MPTGCERVRNDTITVLRLFIRVYENTIQLNKLFQTFPNELTLNKNYKIRKNNKNNITQVTQQMTIP